MLEFTTRSEVLPCTTFDDVYTGNYKQRGIYDCIKNFCITRKLESVINSAILQLIRYAEYKLAKRKLG